MTNWTSNRIENASISQENDIITPLSSTLNLSSYCEDIHMKHDFKNHSATCSFSKTPKSRRQLQFTTSTPINQNCIHESCLDIDSSMPLIIKTSANGSISDDLITKWIVSLEKDFKPSFCLDIFQYMKNLICPGLKRHIDTVMANNFRLMTASQEFLEAQFDFVTHLLQLDEVKIDSEVEVFNAAISWLTFNWTRRKEFVPFVLGNVRFGEMTKQECADIFIKLDSENLGLLAVCQDLLFQPMIYKLTQETSHNQQFAYLAPRPRTHLKLLSRNKNRERESASDVPVTLEQYKSSVENDPNADRSRHGAAAILDVSYHENHMKLAIVCFGGQHSVKTWGTSEAGFGIVGLKPTDANWSKIGKLPEPRSYLTATILVDKIYLSGGYDPQLNCDDTSAIIKATFWCHNIKGSGWQLLSPMRHTRAHHSMVAAHDRIYVIGGQGENGIPLDSVECYDTSARFWKDLSPLPVPSLGMAACQYRGNIWLCGGVSPSDHNSSHGRIMDTVLVYDPTRNLWHYGVPLRIPRAFANLVEFDGNLLIVGGITTTNEFNIGFATNVAVIDCFQYHTQKWVLKSDLSIPRHSTVTAVTGQRFYVIGGISSGMACNDVECYDGLTHQWLTNVPCLQKPLYGAACVVIPILV